MKARPRRRRNPVLEIPVTPECREMIRQGALVSISTSGGKDSQAMTILLARIIPPDQLVAIHAPLGKVEWPGPVEHIENTIPPGLPLIMAETASGKSLLDRVEARGKWRGFDKDGVPPSISESKAGRSRTTSHERDLASVIG